MNKTAVVILNWNGLGYLKKFLEVTIVNSSSQLTKIYVADNASSDGSAEWIEKEYPLINLIRLDKNYGFADGYNKALQQIDAEYFILLNSDIEVTVGWTVPLVGFMEQNPRVASCQPKILSWKNRDEFEYAGAAGGFIDKFGYPFCRGRIFSFVEKDTGQYNSNTEIFWSSGACMIVRADAWKKCLGFDKDFFAHMEEIDLCWRFQKAGYRVCFVPGSVVYHVGGGALPYDSPFKTYLNFRNNLFLLYKNLPDRNFHLNLFLRKSLDALSAAMFLFTGRFKNVVSVLNAHIDYYKSIRVLKLKRESVKKLTITESLSTIMNKSLVLEFYIKGIRTFNKLKMNT
jgi:GT2 family glycosyltransferase